jgi:hypothetical protein
MVAAIASFSARVHTLMLINACACSSAAACVKCTTYIGACRVPSNSSRVSCSGVVTYEYSSGTGRCASLTTAVGRPVRRVRSVTKRLTSPRVADIRMNCARGSSMSGTCQAQPRSGSA